MVEIRKATLRDVEEIIDIMEAFNNYAKMPPLDPAKVSTLVYNTLTNDLGVVFVAVNKDCVVGFISGMVTDDPLRDTLYLVETGWYAYAGGKDLLNNFIEEGKRRNVDEIVLSTLDVSPKHVSTILERKGFRIRETTYSLSTGD